MTTVPTKTRAQWAKQIKGSWSLSLRSAANAVRYAIVTGKDLNKAKEQLAHGEFEEMVNKDLGLGLDKAGDLMRIAKSPIISNPDHGRYLPDGWTILRSIAKMSEKDFNWALRHGLIEKEMTRGAVKAISKAREPGTDLVAISKGERGPTPTEARKIAKATGRLIVASDGNIYSGATEEEQTDYAERRNLVYPIKDAISRIADCESSPAEWVAKSEKHWLQSLNMGKIDDAIAWLSALKAILTKNHKIIDGGRNNAA